MQKGTTVFMKLVNLVLSFLIGFTSLVSGATNFQGEEIGIRGGIGPLPWGTEVPFPWDEIEGTWKAVGSGGIMLNFEVTGYVESSKSRIVSLKLFKQSKNSKYNLVRPAPCIAPEGQRIVRCQGNWGIENPFIIVSAYNEKVKDCSGKERDERVTWLTIRWSEDETGLDESYRLVKVK
jgi:hypothetical protein